MAALAYFITTLRDRFEDEERGATIVEYALVLAVISIVLLIGAGVLTGAVQDLWTTISESLTPDTTTTA